MVVEPIAAVQQLAQIGDGGLWPLARRPSVLVVVKRPLLDLRRPVQKVEYAMSIDDPQAATYAVDSHRMHVVRRSAGEAAEAELIVAVDWHRVLQD